MQNLRLYWILGFMVLWIFPGRDLLFAQEGPLAERTSVAEAMFAPAPQRLHQKDILITPRRVPPWGTLSQTATSGPRRHLQTAQRPRLRRRSDTETLLHSYSVTLLGSYAVYGVTSRSENTTVAQSLTLLDWGKFHSSLYTKNWSMRNFQWSILTFTLTSRVFPDQMTRFKLSGLHLKKTILSVFSGVVPASDLHLARLAHHSNWTKPQSTQCLMPGHVVFDRSFQESLSLRQVSFEAQEDLWRSVSRINPQPPHRHLASQDGPPQNNASAIYTGIIGSPNCGLRIVFAGNEADLQLLGSRLMKFFGVYMVKFTLEIYLFVRQLQSTESIARGSSKVSLLGLQLHTCIDTVELCFLLVQVFAADFMASTFLILAFFKILFVFLIEVRFLLIVLKSHIAEHLQSSELFARLLKLNAAGTAMFLLAIMRFLPSFLFATLLLYGFWIPQILLNVYKGHRRPFEIRFIVGVTLCRAFLPLYLWGVTDNVFDNAILISLWGKPNPTKAYILGLYLSLQAVLLLIQSLFGPRSFLPKTLFPDAYSYYISGGQAAAANAVQKGDDNYECVICMSDVSYIPKAMILTPCNHHFHEKCLHQWMDIKAECPTCRQPLPPIAE